MTSSIDTRLGVLRLAIVNARAPYCAGTLPLRSEDLVVYYGKEEPGSCRRIDFSSENVDALNHLADSCDKVMFGRNQEDVFDETYRKAGKLDNAYFATKLDVVRSGLMTAIRYDLLEGHDGRRSIKAELYKLNVYGKDSFFKPHKDTPRSTTMFGSLVIVLPTQHEGGTLIFRHNSKEWQFDSAKALSEAPEPHLHIAYAIFFSNVEHSVTPVKSGYRVTLTYNLYFDNDATYGHGQMPKSVPANESLLKTMLGYLLADNTFLPDGGYIGFGLRHEYPIELKPKNTSALQFLGHCLKGSDAMIIQACKSFDLETTLKVCYDGDSWCQDKLLIDRDADINGRHLYGDCPLKDYLVKEYDAKVISQCRDCLMSYEERKPDFEVHWVTERTRFNSLEAAYGTYGNEPGAEHVYGLFCLVVYVGPAGHRASLK